MAVEKVADGLEGRDRHPGEDLVGPVGHGRLAGHEGIGREVVAVVVDDRLVGAPAGLELAQALVFGLAASEAQALAALGGVQLDGLPHDDIVGPQVLVGLVRGAVLVDGLAVCVQIDVGGDGISFVIGKRHGAHPFGQDLLVEMLEELPGLGRQAVLAAGEAVEAVELPQGLRGGLEAHRHAFLLGLFDVSPGGVSQALEELCIARGEIEGVSIEPGRGGAVAQKISSSAKLYVFPLPFPAFLNNRFEEHFRDFDMRHEGLAVIGERQADGALAGEEAADFHHRNHRRQGAFRPCKIQRREAIRMGQNFGPRRAMEE